MNPASRPTEDQREANSVLQQDLQRPDRQAEDGAPQAVAHHRPAPEIGCAGGEHAQLHVKYTRGPANRAASDTRFINAANPAQFVMVHGEQETDITRNVTTTPPDRVSEFTYTAGGGKFAADLDDDIPF